MVSTTVLRAGRPATGLAEILRAAAAASAAVMAADEAGPAQRIVEADAPPRGGS
jgi:hypothetical protein